MSKSKQSRVRPSWKKKTQRRLKRHYELERRRFHKDVKECLDRGGVEVTNVDL
jgi:hypothetical protein